MATITPSQLNQSENHVTRFTRSCGADFESVVSTLGENHAASEPAGVLRESGAGAGRGAGTFLVGCDGEEVERFLEVFMMWEREESRVGKKGERKSGTERKGSLS